MGGLQKIMMGGPLSLGDGWSSEDHGAILSGFVYVEIFLYKLLVMSLDFNICHLSSPHHKLWQGSEKHISHY